MIFQRPESWASFWRSLLLFGLFFGSFVGLRFITMVAAGRGEFSGIDLAGAAAFAFAVGVVMQQVHRSP